MDEVERLKQFLLEMHMNEGKVCEDYETCRHRACASSHRMWELADSALQGMTIEVYRSATNASRLDTEALMTGRSIALTIQCFKTGCGARMVVRDPGDGNYPACKCGSFDVSIIETERTPDGNINNCSRANGEPAETCQMCAGGPCPEEAKYRGR